MTPLEKIDFVFNFIKNKIEIGGDWGYYNIWNHVEQTKELQINETLFKEIINKLKEDGLITETSGRYSQHTYHITFKGLTFQGYKYQAEESQRLQRAVTSLSVRTFWLTVVIAGGTFVAAIYYLLEILNHLFSIYPTK